MDYAPMRVEPRWDFSEYIRPQCVSTPVSTLIKGQPSCVAIAERFAAKLIDAQRQEDRAIDRRIAVRYLSFSKTVVY
jgi:hypothetical protein